MRILVTGSTGCLGRNLVERLLEDGHQVTATGRNENIGKILTLQGAIFKPANLHILEEMKALFAHQDIVYHCAALSSIWGKYHDFYEANVIATQNIIKGCMENDVKRLIYVSTPSIYFDFTERLNIKESDAITNKPANNYVKTKILAEKAIDEAFTQGLPVITIRPRGIFGPYDTAILPRIIRLNQQKKLPLINNGTGVIDLTYVGNVVESLLLCKVAPSDSLGKKYNITNGEPIAMIDFLQKLLAAVELPMQTKKISYQAAYCIATLLEWIAKASNYRYEPKITRYSVGLLAKSQTLNIEPARLELNYIPRYSLEEGIFHFAKWWKQHVAC